MRLDVIVAQSGIGWASSAPRGFMIRSVEGHCEEEERGGGHSMSVHTL